MASMKSATSVVQKPPWSMRPVFDPLTVFLVGRLGMDDHNGTRVLEVRGRASGIWRATPVRVLELEGKRFLVGMYGETSWARNLRKSGVGRLRIGGRVTEFRATELSGDDKLAAFRAYLTRWWPLVKGLSGLDSPEAPDEQVRKVAATHPVFRLAEISQAATKAK
jgi:deazaflavin-dependent oxidoreductase (nitroreductase family)